MKKITYILSTFLLLFGTSCTDYLSEKSHVDVDKEKFMNNAKEAEYVLQGVYHNLVNEGLYAYNLSMCFTITTDIAQCEGSAISNFREVPTNAFNKSNAQVQQTWQQLYAAIYTANDFLETIQAKKGSYNAQDQAKAEIFIGEAKALRALFYFELVRWFGHVTLVTTPAESEKDPTEMVQDDPEAVYAQIEKDLKEAIEILPWATDTDRPYKMSKGSAYGLLTKVYATWAGYPVRNTAKWKEAANTAKALIESGKHALNPNFGAVWTNTCNGRWEPRESLIEVSFYAPTVTGNSAYDPIGRIGKWNGVKATKEDPSGGNAGNVKVVYAFTSKWQQQIIHDTLSGYPEDIRYHYSLANYQFVYDTIKKITWASPYTKAGKEPQTKELQLWTPRKWSTEFVEKGNILVNNDKSNINWYILRYSDVLLLYAEALNELRGAGEGVDMTPAYEAINQVRRRAHGEDAATPLPGIDIISESYEEFTQTIRNERAYELCFEGHRRPDLVRWGIYYQTIQETSQWLNDWWDSDSNPTPNYTAARYTIEGKHELFPIPQREMDLMTQYKQNPKW